MYQQILVSLFALLLFGCQSAAKPIKITPPKPISPVQDTLNKHLSMWKNVNIRDYSYEFQRSCFCLREYTKAVLIQVKNGIVTDAKFKDNNKPLPSSLKGNRQTIDNLFETIQDAIDRKADSIEVRYNEQYGFPTSIAVDYDQRMADEELYIKASHFRQ